MTGFTGIFLRDRNAKLPRDMAAKLRGGLSRFAGEAISSYQSPGFFLCAFDIGAWPRDASLSTGDKHVFAAAGDPVGETGRESLPTRIERKEQVCRALQQSDDAALTRFVGSYAAVLFDADSHRVTLCVDRLGLRPLYVHSTAQQITFATSLRVLRLALGEAAEPDEAGIAQIALFGQGLGDSTPIRNTIVLQPAEKIVVESERTHRTRYFRWDQIEPIDVSADEACKRLKTAFQRAVARRRQTHPEEWAFLSGGMDSRCVVGALVESGASVASFSSSIAGTADAVIAPMVAASMGTRHHTNLRTPEQRMSIVSDSFALYARRHFEPAMKLFAESGFCMWSGDGGSVGMGHVYLTEAMVEAARRDDRGALLQSINPHVGRFVRRTLRSGFVERFRSHASAALEHEIARCTPPEKGRLPFLFYLLNDQHRHLFGHYEDIDRSRIELLTPFYDMDFLAEIVAMPIDLFLGHKLYNRWMNHFPAYVHGLPWQAYPGHEPCPHPLPAGAITQWDGDIYRTAAVDRTMSLLVRQIKRNAPQPVWSYLSRTALTGFDWAARLGFRRYNYEVQFARTIAEAIGADLTLDQAA